MENKVSEVRWYPIEPTEKGLIGFASLKVDTVVLNNIAVFLTPDGGYRLVFPDKVLANGRKVELFHPTDNETLELFITAIADKIKSITEKSKNATADYTK